MTYTRRVVRKLNVAGNALPFALGAVTVGVLAADQGGYFATSWGWAALGLLIVAAVTVSLGPTPVVTRPTLVMLGGLAALVLWSALSITWSTPTAAMPEVERTALYLVAALAVSLLADRGSLAPLVGGVLAAITLIAIYSLATRLLPDRLGVFDPVATYRLSEPVGYWNALGLIAALAVLLAVGLAARAESVAAGALAAATLPVLVLTIYFTFSRGSWAALFVGLVVATAFDRRPTAFATVAVTLSVPAAIAVLLASKSRALTTEGQSLAQAAHDGHRLIPFVLLLTVVSAALAWAVRPLRGFALPRIVRRAVAALALAALVAALVALALRPHAPGSAAHRLYTQFNGGVPATPNGNLTRRLFSLSSDGRVDAWRVALHVARAEPLHGLGAGSYEASWLLRRPVPVKIVDAHNVYLETLAELGAVGLALLLLVFATPLTVLRSRRRAEPLAAAVAGAYAVFLAHALVDWDWELPAVTLAGLFCGLALVAVRTDGTQVRLPKPLVLGAIVPLAVLAVFVQLGWSSLAAAQADVAAGHWQAAERKAKQAQRWQPWSSEPWTVRGNARLEAGDYRGARAEFARATRVNPGDWHSWYDLALASSGAERKRAVARALRLNPFSPETAGLESVPAVAH